MTQPPAPPSPAPPRLAYAFGDAAPEHLRAMGDLWVSTWARTLPEIDFEARRPWLHDHLAERTAAGAVTRLAFCEGILAGFVVIDPGTGYLDQLAVAPTFWGKGAAEALMGEARRLSPARVALDVNQDNPRAVRFYEKMGFLAVSEGMNPMSGRRTFRMEWRPTAAAER